MRGNEVDSMDTLDRHVCVTQGCQDPPGILGDVVLQWQIGEIASLQNTKCQCYCWVINGVEYGLYMVHFDGNNKGVKNCFGKYFFNNFCIRVTCAYLAV